MITAQGAYTYDKAYLPRWNAEIPVATDGSRPSQVQWFPVRPICLVLGIDSRSQLAALKSNPRFGSALLEVPIKSNAGWRATICIRRDKLSHWLLDIDPQRCALKAREELDAFQQELLAEGDRILFGRAPRTPSHSRGLSAYTVRVEFRISCLDCGAPHYVLYENGEVTVVHAVDDQ